MENNVAYVAESEELRQGVHELVDRALELAQVLGQHPLHHARIARGGRKAHSLRRPVEAQSTTSGDD
jgi:hypothetical protein